MFLKSLELEGFKSFVDPTRLNFDNGFTAVVGPNGCGKSNVSDAIRWVIGEQSSKSLRGTRITDLIFNGSGSRKPVNRTEISLTLTNVPPDVRIASVTNLAEEVKVTRCYHRSGESEFYINQVPCRLKDITDFLLDVGISPKVLTVIEQGHIQDIITSKAEERRMLIEEAAGILKFKYRRNEAIRKLDVSAQNLERITDIVQELNRQAESLKRQASKAERYKQYQIDIKNLSLKLFSKKIRRYQSELQQIEEEFSKFSDTKAEWSARASTLDNRITEIGIKIEEQVRGLNIIKDKVVDLAGHIGKDEHNIELKKSQIVQAEEESKGATEDISRMNAEIERLSVEKERQRVLLGTISEDINSHEEILQQQSEGLDAGKESIRSLDEQIKEGDQKILSLYHRISQRKNDLTALETRRKHIEDRDESLRRDIADIESQTEAGRISLEGSQSDHNLKAQGLEDTRRNLQELIVKADRCREEIRTRSEKQSSLKEEYLTQSSLLSSLNELRNKFEGFQDGVKSLMVHGVGDSPRPSGLREVLVDILKAPAEYEPALEAVLGEKLQSVIVDSYSDGVQAIEYLKNNQSGRGSFLPLHSRAVPSSPVVLNGNPDVYGKMVDFVECKEEYRSIINLLLENVVLVKDLNTAITLRENPSFHGILVTQNGEMIDSIGLVTGGTVLKKSSSLLSRNRQIESLAQAVESVKNKMAQAEREVDDEKNVLTSLKENIRQEETCLKEKEIERANGQKDLEQLSKELERLTQKFSALEYERSSGSHELKELCQHGDSLHREVTSDEEQKTEAEEQLAEKRIELESKRNELESKSAEVSAVKVRIASLIGKRENTLTEIKRIGLQKENLEQRIQKQEDSRRENVKKITDGAQEISIFEKRILEQVRDKDRLTQERVREEEALLEKEMSLKDMEKEIRELTRQIQEITEKITRIEISRSETKIQIAHLEERAFDDFNVSREEILNTDGEDIDEASTDETVRALKGKIARMGEVNLAALSDYEEVNKRFTFLKKQQEDLADSIGMLHETIEKINRTTKERFLDTFEQVGINFQEIFARLFQGGRAKLTLTDPTLPLESGIEIAANPAGKSMQNLSLLSGGEKTMTAIALMFAVFKVRPSPFCLLDEVDAPLDEANVIRFQEMLKEMAVNTQFILTTHNQKTMSFADVLYGITMEEKGVSKAVSVHLN